MKNICLIILVALISSCGSTRKKDSHNLKNNNDQENVNKITFLFLKIKKDPNGTKNLVELVDIKESTGRIKDHRIYTAPYYLSIYALSGDQIVDSLALKHPLYKHLEYIDENQKFAFKDTIVQSEDFFVRLQGNFNKLKIFETLKNKPTKLLKTIKF